VVRDRKTLSFNVTVSELNLADEREPAAADENPAPQPEAPVETEFGMSVVNLTAAERRELQLPNGAGGVMVERVTPYGPAAQAPLEEGDVILSIAGAPVRSTGDVTTLLGRLTSGRVARIIVWRDREEVLVQWRKR
jgi:S1-C subfamily serine protease